MQKILLTGASGFVGAHVLSFYGDAIVCAPSHAELDITDADRVRALFERVQPEVVIHCAAVSDVGACEREPEFSYRINVDGSRNIALASAHVGAKCLICSSDQVYAGSASAGAHTEDEMLSPANVYGREKLRAETECLSVNPECVALRLSWMYEPQTSVRVRGDFWRMLTAKLPSGDTFSYSDAERRGITDVREVVRNLEGAARLPGGVYNFGAPNDKTMYETARALFLHRGWDAARVQKSDSARSQNLSMSPDKLRRAGIVFADTLGGLIRIAEETGV